MELCFYNSVMTGMSESGREFTYVNQMASTDADLSQRAKWFTCACCPPNVTRLLGYIGGYLWTSTVNEKESSAEINIHMYSSALLSIPVGAKVLEIEQRSKWPWDGKVEFEIRSDIAISTTIRLRIPSWTENWTSSPELPNPTIEKGYLTLPPDWLKNNQSFSLNLTMKPRLISPHPYTNQDIVALARGPIVYCVEDVDNKWVKDHFKSLCLDVSGRIEEIQATSDGISEPYIGLTMHNAASVIKLNDTAAPGVAVQQVTYHRLDGVDRLHFIPYALRANRGGKGHMRVGIRRKP